MDYGFLIPTGQRAMIESRLGQLEVEHYQYTLNLKVALEWPDESPLKAQQIAEAHLAIAQADAAHAVLKAELATLPAPELPPAPPVIPQEERHSPLAAVPPLTEESGAVMDGGIPVPPAAT